MNEPQPIDPTASQSEAISPENRPFLEEIRKKAELEDIYDARDVAEIVFRTMRDLMTTEAADRVKGELQSAVPTDAITLQNQISQLWQDTNPLVAFLSRIRPPLQFDDETFLFRIRQEGGLQGNITPEKAVSAVFSATKAELSPERVAEIAGYLPGKIKTLWQQA